jgi:hypothetical protein
MIGSRSRKHDDSSLNMQRPKKRVRISFEKSKIYRYRRDDVDGDFEQPEFLTDASQQAAQERQQKQRRRTWLTKRDLTFFRASAKKLCLSINLDSVLEKAYHGDSMTADWDRSKALIESNDYVMQRGLERWSSSHHAFLRSSKVVEHKTAVILEQSIQFLSGKTDANKLAQVAREASVQSQRFAQILALADFREAMQVQRDAMHVQAADAIQQIQQEASQAA